MGLLGSGWADPQSAANMSLAAGLLSGNFGAGLLNANKAYTDTQQNALRNQLAQVQMDNMRSEMDLRKNQLARQQQLQSLLYGYLSPTSAPSVPAAPGQLGSGSFGAVSPSAGMPSIPTIPAPAAGGSRIGSMSPDMLAMLKLNGLDLTDVYKEARPDMQVSNGYAYDRRALQPGFMPGYSVSQNGQAQLTTIGANGLPQISAPPGALDTYRAYRNADAGIASQNELVQIAAPDGSMRYVPKSMVLGGAQPSAMPAPGGVPSARPVSMPSDSDRFAILSQELQSAQNEGRTGDVAALQREIARLPASARVGANPSGLAVPGFQATPTTAQAANASATKINAEEVAKQIADQRKSIMSADFAAPTNIAKYQRIGQLLQDVDGGKYTPAGTEVASALNSFGIKIDKNLGNKQAAMSIANEAALQLRNPASGAGMPGAMSDADRAFLASMTPNLSQSADGRKQIIQSYIAVQQRNQQVAQFARKYEQKYGRLDNGFFDQLSAWSSANPLFRAK